MLDSDDDPVGRGDADGRRTAYAQPPDGFRDGRNVPASGVDYFAGQARLVQQYQHAFACVPPDGREIHDCRTFSSCRLCLLDVGHGVIISMNRSWRSEISASVSDSSRLTLKSSTLNEAMTLPCTMARFKAPAPVSPDRAR